MLIVINGGAPVARGVQEERADERQGGLQEGRTRRGWAKFGDGKERVLRTQGLEERRGGARVSRKPQGHGRQ